MDDPTSLNASKCLHKMVIKSTPVEEVGVSFCDDWSKMWVPTFKSWST